MNLFKNIVLFQIAENNTIYIDWGTGLRHTRGFSGRLETPLPKFAANLSLMFAEQNFLDRFDAAAAAGFDAVECQFPYAFPIQVLAARLQRTGLRLVLHNMPAGDWAAGDRGLACHPHRVAEFRAGVDRALDYAHALDCDQLNVLAGIAVPGVPREILDATLVENLTYAADRLQRAGIRLVVEALNTQDTPGFHVTSTARAADLIKATGADNIALQYDAYHMHIQEDDGLATVRRYGDQIAHIQVADVPGRHEPGSGEIDFPALFRGLDGGGYQGWVGCEYVPATTTAAGLGWMEAYRPEAPRTATTTTGTTTKVCQ